MFIFSTICCKFFCEINSYEYDVNNYFNNDYNGHIDKNVNISESALFFTEKGSYRHVNLSKIVYDHNIKPISEIFIVMDGKKINCTKKQSECFSNDVSALYDTHRFL